MPDLPDRGTDPGRVTLLLPTPKKPPTVGDHISATLEVVTRPGFSAATPDITRDLLPVEVLQVKESALRKNADGTTTRNYRLILALFDTGNQVVPPVKVPFTGPDGKTIIVQSAPLHITIASVLPAAGTKEEQAEGAGTERARAKGDQADQLRDIKPPLGLPLPAWFYLAAAGLAAALATAGYLLWRRWRRIRGFDVATEAALPLDQRARERLAALDLAEHYRRGAIKQFYISLSEVMRQFIEGRYRIRALDLTTREILRESRILEIPAADLEKIRTVLLASDLVKFAGDRPGQDQAQSHYQQAGDVVFKQNAPQGEGEAQAA